MKLSKGYKFFSPCLKKLIVHISMEKGSVFSNFVFPLLITIETVIRTANLFLLSIMPWTLNSTATAQNEPVIIEADSGTLGAACSVLPADGVQYVTTKTNLINSGNPGSAARIISFEVTFPDTGTYDLYGRVRVGPGADNDDSFFYPNGFGTKDPVNDSDWITVNNIKGLGFSEPDDFIYGI